MMTTSSDERVRPASPLDEILGIRFPVLDDGFVRVVDYMGNDSAIVQAARVSYGQGTKLLSEDRGLIRYLMRQAHTTPFEMCELKLHVRVPMDCWRQWIRHRTASVNEYSTRYSLAIDSARRTDSSGWRTQSTGNKQGSGGPIDEAVGQILTQEEQAFLARSREVYEARIAAGVAREQARKDLPLSTYTEAFWKIDLHNLLHFLRLRMDSHAQAEIREYATTIGNHIVSKWCPMAWEAFVDYQQDVLSLTNFETELVAVMVRGDTEAAIEMARNSGLLARGTSGWKANRERDELETKLLRLQLPVPWREQS